MNGIELLFAFVGLMFVAKLVQNYSHAKSELETIKNKLGSEAVNWLLKGER